jgi:hypothetical protein
LLAVTGCSPAAGATIGTGLRCYSMEERSKRTQLTQDYVLQGICRIVERTVSGTFAKIKESVKPVDILGIFAMGELFASGTSVIELNADSEIFPSGYYSVKRLVLTTPTNRVRH